MKTVNKFILLLVATCITSYAAEGVDERDSNSNHTEDCYNPNLVTSSDEHVDEENCAFAHSFARPVSQAVIWKALQDFMEPEKVEDIFYILDGDLPVGQVVPTSEEGDGEDMAYFLDIGRAIRNSLLEIVNDQILRQIYKLLGYGFSEKDFFKAVYHMLQKSNDKYWDRINLLFVELWEYCECYPCDELPPYWTQKRAALREGITMIDLDNKWSPEVKRAEVRRKIELEQNRKATQALLGAVYTKVAAQLKPKTNHELLKSKLCRITDLSDMTLREIAKHLGPVSAAIVKEVADMSEDVDSLTGDEVHIIESLLSICDNSKSADDLETKLVYDMISEISKTPINELKRMFGHLTADIDQLRRLKYKAEKVIAEQTTMSDLPELFTKLLICLIECKDLKNSELFYKECAIDPKLNSRAPQGYYIAEVKIKEGGHTRLILRPINS